jgi:hypothetical protein
MRLDSSGNLGIGTNSPSAKLQVVGIVASTGSGTSIFAAGEVGTYTLTGITSPNYGIAYGVLTGRPNPALTVSGFDAIAFGTNQAERMRLDSSGNLGLGVTPSAWGSGWPALQVKGGAVWSDGNTRSFLSTNVYFDGSSRRYIGTAAAFQYAQDANGHNWAIAPSGTAGNAITFTQAMTLDTDGDLGIGTTSPSARLHVSSGAVDEVARFEGTGNPYISVYDSGTRQLYFGSISASLVDLWVETNKDLRFATNNVERARITSGGDLLINATATSGFFDGKLNVAGRIHAKSNEGTGRVQYIWNTATTGDNGFIEFATEGTYTARGSIVYNRTSGLTQYNTTSDYRAKDIFGPVANPGATIDALKVYTGKMKGATQSRPMLVAHEAQEHAPYAVSGVKDEVNDDGTPKFQQMDVSSLVPLLIAEIQSLRARIAALESKGA